MSEHPPSEPACVVVVHHRGLACTLMLGDLDDTCRPARRIGNSQ